MPNDAIRIEGIESYLVWKNLSLNPKASLIRRLRKLQLQISKTAALP